MRTYHHYSLIYGEPWQSPVLVTLSELDCTMKIVPQANPSRNPLLWFLKIYSFKQRRQKLNYWRDEREPQGGLMSGTLWATEDFVWWTCWIQRGSEPTLGMSRVRAFGTDLQKDSVCPSLKANLGLRRRDVRAPVGWRWACLLMRVHSLHKQILRAWHLATEWQKWHTIKEPEDLACSQETASGHIVHIMSLYSNSWGNRELVVFCIIAAAVP